MDEPFINLDIGLKFSLIKKLKERLNVEPKTVVAVTHDVKEAVALADKIIVLSNGKIIKEIDDIKESTEKELFDTLMKLSKLN